MNILFVQEAVSAKPLNSVLHNVLTFLYFLPHQFGLWIIKILQQMFPRIVFTDSLIDPLGFLIILTLFVVLARVAQKLAWIIVCLGWILLLVRIVMIIFKIG